MAVKEKSKVKSQKLKVDLFSATGEKKGKVNLPEALFGQKPNKALLAQAVRVFLSNQRSAHAKVKSRGEIQSSTRKIYRQKGTGGARHGARSAPIFVGGGIAHGPKGIENYNLTMPKTLRKLALVSALSKRAQAGEVMVADFDKVEPKTGKVARALGKIVGKSSLTLVSTGGDLARAARNISGVNLVSAKEISAYHILLGKALVVTPGAIEKLEARVKPVSAEAKGEK